MKEEQNQEAADAKFDAMMKAIKTSERGDLSFIEFPAAPIGKELILEGLSRLYRHQLSRYSAYPTDHYGAFRSEAEATASEIGMITGMGIILRALGLTDAVDATERKAWDDYIRSKR